MDIAILGRGRLGRTLALLLPREGHRVSLLGRGEIPDRGRQVVLLCVPDEQIAEAARAIPQGPIVMHCSGATDLQPLSSHARAGSFHPLMSFPGPEVSIPDLAGVPVALAGSGEAIAAGRQIAASLGMTPFEVPGDRRLYHAAAVIAGNFATVLVSEAADVLAKAGVERDLAARLLIPLALRSIEGAAHPLSRSLTGPIARGDRQTLAAHRAALSEHGLSQTAAIYDMLVRLADLRLGRPAETGGSNHSETDCACTGMRRC